MRTLQFLQDSIAQGTVASDDARRKLIDLVGKRFLEADAETWNDRRNADAALLYVLNGGNPAVLARLPTGDGITGTHLIAAVTAYATGSTEDARSLWEGIDISTLPAGLVGPAALVKANLLFDSDPAQALRFADIARLESPGTLVEEAAIRRGIEIAAKLGDSRRFEFYSVSYTTRFPRSTYGASFRRRFSESYLSLASKGDPATAPQLDTILAPLNDQDRRDIYLEVARQAVVNAEMARAKTAAEDAALLSVPGTDEMFRAKLYRAAAMAVSANPGDAREELDALDGKALQPGDRDLLNAVLVLVDQIQRWPEPATVAPPADAAEMSAEGEPSVGDIAARAKSVMAAAAATMAGVGE